MSFILLSRLPDHPPGIHQPLQIPGSIGGTCRWQCDRFNPRLFLLISRIERAGRAPVAVHGFYGCRPHDLRKVSRNCVPDAAVTGSLYITTVNNIPQCDVLMQKEFLFFLYRLWHRLLTDPGRHFPEAVSRMSVKESLLPGTDRRKTSKYKYL